MRECVRAGARTRARGWALARALACARVSLRTCAWVWARLLSGLLQCPQVAPMAQTCVPLSAVLKRRTAPWRR
eukprot:12971767-Alexandrium_andersonii.AAC.1